MNEFPIQCPSCGFSFTAEDSHVGLSTNCANCGSEFVIERSDGSDAPPRCGQVRADEIPVTSGDISDTPYSVVGMVCFTVGTRGEMRTHFDSLKQVTAYRLAAMKTKGQVSQGKGVGQLTGGVGIDSDGNVALSGEYSGATFQSSDLEVAFHIAVNQLQLRAKFLGANAVVGFRYVIDFDSNHSVLNFMATAYGTAVRLQDQHSPMQRH